VEDVCAPLKSITASDLPAGAQIKEFQEFDPLWILKIFETYYVIFARNHLEFVEDFLYLPLPI
jgi:hypothetical protein